MDLNEFRINSSKNKGNFVVLNMLCESCPDGNRIVDKKPIVPERVLATMHPKRK